MSNAIHFDELSDRRIRTHDEIVIGERYLLCHVPMENPIRFGLLPYCSERRIIEIAYLSYNDIHGIPPKEIFDDPETPDRLRNSEVLNTKHWSFRTQERPFSDGQPYINWHICTDQGLDLASETRYVNYLLPLDRLAQEGIEVLRTPSKPYVLSEELKEELEFDRRMYADLENQDWWSA